MTKQKYIIPLQARNVKDNVWSDIAISAAGQTIYELSLYRCATIAITVADNQKNNLMDGLRKSF